MRVETIKKEIFTFAELDESTKEEAIAKFYRDDWPDLDSVSYDFCKILEIMGIELDSHNGRKSLYWSGFWSQGDGASFAGDWNYSKGSVAAIKKYAPQDQELHRIAAAIQKAASRVFYRVSARITQSGHYVHEMTMRIDCEMPDSYSQSTYSEIESELLECFRDLARWFYKSLESEYEYQTGHEAFSELCEVNEYEFDSNGNLV